jgi:hypothetical protein
MATNESLKETLELFKQQRSGKLDEVRALDITIRQIQMQLGEHVEQADTLFPGGTMAEVKIPAQPPARVGAANYKPRIDEFFNQSIAEAASSYLDKIGQAASVEEILKTITAGGCKVGGADPKRTLAITLAQGKREFVAIGGGVFGLRKFYANLPKLGRPEATISPKKAKRKNSAKKTAKRSLKPKPGVVVKAYDQAAVVAAVAEVFGDNQPKSPDEVVKAVEKRVGFSVKKLAIYGMLRKKDFEQVGDKYRLRKLPEEGRPVVQ